MKKITSIILTTFLSITTIFAVGVNETELKNNSNKTIEFQNYTGPHRVIESAQSIKDIGGNLGKNISPTIADSTGYSKKYYLVHSVEINDKSDKKLDADILYIGEDANVDHINNVRRIICGYLESAYGYSTKDAETLSVFITVYNAVYRGKYDELSEKYKSSVMTNLSKNNCGLSTSYLDWPGKSEIIIPLFDVENGGLSTVDTSVISDSKVIESMKKDDDRNIDSRKDMVDLKEREADEASNKATEAQKKAVEEQKKLNEAKKAAEEAEQKALEESKKAEEAKKYAEENPDDKKAQEEAKKAEEAAELSKEKAEQAENELEKQKEETDKAKQEAAEKQTISDKKQTEAQTERKEIATDQQIVQKEEQQKARAKVEYGLVITEKDELLSKLVKFNIENGDIVKSSPVTVIRGRDFYENSTKDGFIVIAGQNTKNGTIKLVLLDSDKMEIVKESNEIIAEDSPLLINNGYLYCVIKSDSDYFVGKYDENLSLIKKSSIKVAEQTPITFNSMGIAVTDSTGLLKILDSDTLDEKYSKTIIKTGSFEK